MAAVGEVRAILTDEAQVRLVDDRRCLEGVARPLVAEIADGDLAQLAVEQLEDLGLGVAIALAPAAQEVGDRTFLPAVDAHDSNSSFTRGLTTLPRAFRGSSAVTRKRRGTL